MVQNHIMELLALVGMEPPINMDADKIKAKEDRTPQSIRPDNERIREENLVRGQYTGGIGAPAPGGRGHGEKIAPYKEENTYRRRRTSRRSWP